MRPWQNWPRCGSNTTFCLVRVLFAFPRRTATVKIGFNKNQWNPLFFADSFFKFYVLSGHGDQSSIFYIVIKSQNVLNRILNNCTEISELELPSLHFPGFMESKNTYASLWAMNLFSSWSFIHLSKLMINQCFLFLLFIAFDVFLRVLNSPSLLSRYVPQTLQLVFFSDWYQQCPFYLMLPILFSNFRQ